MTTQPTFEEVLGCQAALYEWAESYDTKDADRLSKCIAPTLRIDYRAFLSKHWPAMPAPAFITMALDPLVLGSPLLKTQHLVGTSRYEKTSEDEITGYHQMRVAHQKYKDAGMKEVVKKGHAHGMGTIWYRRVEGVWKFAGIEPGIRWSEFDHEEIFEEGEGKFGEEGGS